MRLTDLSNSGTSAPIDLGKVKLCGGEDNITLRPLGKSRIKRTSPLVRVKYLGGGQFGGVTSSGSRYLFEADPSTVFYAAERYGLSVVNIERLRAQLAETSDFVSSDWPEQDGPEQGQNVRC